MNDLAKRWLDFAMQDLRGAELMLREGMYNLACFHTQQCVEKALKGMLANQNKTPPRIHATGELLTFFPESLMPDLRLGLAGLDNYYIPKRYPDALPGILPDGLPGKVEAKEAVTLAQSAFAHITESLS